MFVKVLISRNMTLILRIKNSKGVQNMVSRESIIELLHQRPRCLCAFLFDSFEQPGPHLSVDRLALMLCMDLFTMADEGENG